MGSCLLASCGGETGTNPPPPPGECTETVSVLVSNGTIPAFSWTPGCMIGRLIVEMGPEEQWGTETSGANIYLPPVHYGVHPPGSVEEQQPIPLVPGQTYRVSLYRWISTVPESLQLVGVKDFIP